MSTRIRVVVVDDHTVFREGIEAVLAGRDGVEIVGSFGDAPAVLAALGALAPDIVLMDLHLPGMGGIAATAAIAADHPGVRVLVLSMLDDPASVRAAIDAGASGYLVKTSSLDDIVRGVRAVHEGQLILGSTVSRHLSGTPDAGRAARLAAYTPREHDVLRLLAVGATTSQIAERLGIAPKTVRNMLSLLYLKLGIEDRGQAVLAARELMS